ncbi:MAG TPA: hypothetical protein EYN67_06050, partial [Flavobacteriales bacterium]|nr:hypothetical protein [Flavobacteriales bacterium]
FGIWRSASKYKGHYFWAGLAKTAVVLGLMRLALDYGETYMPAIQESLEQGVWLSNVKWDIQLSSDGQEVEVSGGIARGINEDFKIVLGAAKNVSVVHVNLHGGGGW